VIALRAGLTSNPRNWEGLSRTETAARAEVRRRLPEAEREEWQPSAVGAGFAAKWSRAAALAGLGLGFGFRGGDGRPGRLRARAPDGSQIDEQRMGTKTRRRGSCRFSCRRSRGCRRETMRTGRSAID